VSWRVGSISKKDKTKAKALAYLDARDVMNRLDAVCGPANWQCRYSHAAVKTVCDIGLRVDSEWVWKADGAGDTDIEAEKGSLSDAFKRSAVRWGIGRYLYDLPSPWVTINEFKQIEESEMPKLRALLAKDAKAHETPAASKTPPPTQTATDTIGAKGWDYVGLDGVVGKELTGGRWMDRMEGDLKRLNGPKTKVHWEANERVARRIVESVNDALRSTVQARFDRLTDLVSENISPVSA
jgi:hypothetical protein